jgi:hypothetical protein
MKKYTRQMMAAWPAAVHLIIELMTQPGNGMGITGVTRRKGPFHVGPVQTIQNMHVLSDVFIIVVVDKIMVKRLREDDRHNHDQENTDENRFEIVGFGGASDNSGLCAGFWLLFSRPRHSKKRLETASLASASKPN